MDGLQLLAGMVNLGTEGITLKGITGLLETQGIGFSPIGGYHGGQIRGQEGKYVIFWNKEEWEKAAALRPNPDVPLGSYRNSKLLPTTGRESEIPLVMSDDPRITHSWVGMIEKQCNNATKFAEECRKSGRVPFDFINDKFANIQRNNAILRFSGDIEHPTLTLLTIPIQYATLEDEIETKAYLVPFLAGEGAKWIRNRYCEECGKLFFYKLERARFCSQECRIRANNKKARREK